MGFTWAQSTEALKTHTTLEEVVEALFGGDRNWAPGGECHKKFLEDESCKDDGHFDDTLVLKLSHSNQILVPVGMIWNNWWCKRRMTTRGSGLSYKQAVLERSRLKTLRL